MKTEAWAWCVGCVIAAAMFLLPLITLVHAHDHGQFGQYSATRDEWLRSQRNPRTGTSCCGKGDASLVDEDIRDGKYWIRWTVVMNGREFEVDWTEVPEDKVLPYPNPTGEPVVWWYPKWEGNKLRAMIYCYAPGALF